VSYWATRAIPPTLRSVTLQPLKETHLRKPRPAHTLSLKLLSQTRAAALTLALTPAFTAALSPLSVALKPRPAQAAVGSAVGATMWVGAVAAHPAARHGLALVAEMVLDRTGLKGYLEERLKALLPKDLRGMSGPALMQAGELAVKGARLAWCSALPERCTASAGSLPLPSNLGGMIGPVADIIVQNRTAHLIGELQSAVMMGQLGLGALVLVSIAHTEYRFRQLQEQILLSRQEITAQISDLSARLGAQMSELQGMLERVERTLDDQLRGKILHAHACAVRLKNETRRAQVDGCLHTIMGAHSELVQRGYTPEMELTLLGMELALLVGTQGDGLDPDYLKEIWNTIDATPSPSELREGLMSAACERAQGGAPEVLIRREGQRAPSIARCELTGSWLAEAVKGHLQRIGAHLAQQDNQRFEEHRQDLADQMRALLGVSSQRELRALAQDARSDHLVERADQRTRRWVREETKGLEGELLNTLKLSVSLVPHLNDRVMTVRFNGAPLLPRLSVDGGRVVYHYEVKPQSSSLTLAADLTYEGMIPGMSWVTRCRISLDEAALREIAERAEGLVGGLDCTQDGEFVRDALSYVIKGSFER
jgi:hypothetical protein